jgi:hypothetical protein
VTPPRVADSPVALECVLADTREFGSCTVVFGQVVHIAVDEAVLRDDRPGHRPASARWPASVRRVVHHRRGDVATAGSLRRACPMTTTAPPGSRAASRAAGTPCGPARGRPRQVFAASGFAEASIADVVARADASVGSLYHHFGGKAELYLALFDDYQLRQEDRAARRVKDARATGEADPLALFVAGARAYLDGCWAERDLARLFLAGGGPPGFESVARRRYREWTRRNATLLETRSTTATSRGATRWCWC